jgi:hypothetical protein
VKFVAENYRVSGIIAPKLKLYRNRSVVLFVTMSVNIVRKIIMANTVKVGDPVYWKGSFGMSPPKVVRVASMEITQYPRTKDGDPAGEVSWDIVNENRVIFDLENGHWAYSEQISPVPDLFANCTG